MIIQILDDLDLEKIITSGQCFRPGLLSDGSARFLNGSHAVTLRRTGETAFEADCSPEEWDTVWHSYFDLDRCYCQIRESIPREDPFLRAAAACGKGIRILRQNPWETLVTFIISQRKNIPAIRGAVESLCERFGEPLSYRGEQLSSFPSPEKLAALSPEELAPCRLGYRTPYVLDAARRVADGELDLEGLRDFPDGQLTERLKAVYGVGEKVARCVALFAYGRTGLAPVDTWIGKIIKSEYKGKDPFTPYGENAGILQQYAFYYAICNKTEF